jgi:hypothetical protein
MHAGRRGMETAMRRSGVFFLCAALLGCSEPGTGEVTPPRTPAGEAANPPPAASETPKPAADAKSTTPPLVEPDVPTGADAKRDAELKTQAAAILGVYNDFAPWPTPDGKKVAFISDRDGISPT